MMPSFNVAALDKLFDELTGRLLRHSKVLGDVRDGRVSGANAKEDKTVRRTHICKATGSHTRLYLVDHLRSRS
jgi:hypothetical protein